MVNQRNNKIAIFLFLSIFTFVISAQSADNDNSQSPVKKLEDRKMGEGKITIRQSDEMEKLINNYINNNKSASGIDGYRIQLYSGTGAASRQEAQEVRGKLLSNFPNEKVTVEYNAPFWRVRVGSYRHKHEALPLLRKVKEKFPNSYVVRDSSIRLSDFK